MYEIKVKCQKTCTGYCFALICVISPMFFRVTSLAPWQSHDCPVKKPWKLRVQNDWAKPRTMMTSLNGNSFRVTAPLWGESTGHRWIPLTKASDAELWCFLWSAPKQTFEQTIETLWFETPSHENARNPPVTRGFPPTKASGAELWCFLWSAPEQTIEQTIEKPVI